jgi:hypothetical protein
MMAAHGLSLLAGMLLAFPRYSDWEPPKSTPAAVQSVPGFGRDAKTIGQLERQVRMDISRGVRNGDLSHSEAKGLRRQATYIDALQSRYAEDGLSDSELMELQNRLEALRSIIYATGSRIIPK